MRKKYLKMFRLDNGIKRYIFWFVQKVFANKK